MVPDYVCKSRRARKGARLLFPGSFTHTVWTDLVECWGRLRQPAAASCRCSGADSAPSSVPFRCARSCLHRMFRIRCRVVCHPQPPPPPLRFLSGRTPPGNQHPMKKTWQGRVDAARELRRAFAKQFVFAVGAPRYLRVNDFLYRALAYSHAGTYSAHAHVCENEHVVPQRNIARACARANKPRDVWL